jgi:ElaB/YqjD/DUF883 family membrane-anchored ribosome-binding protein
MDQTQQNGKTDIADSQAANSNARDKLVDGLKSAIGEAESWIRDAAERGEEAISETRARFDETLRTAKNDLRKLEDSVIAHSRSAAECTDAYVQDNPWRAVGIGAAVGVLVGLLISRQ